MKDFIFTTYITIRAEDYDDAISVFDYHTKDLNTYVAEIEEEA
jgi:hypothetical protein